MKTSDPRMTLRQRYEAQKTTTAKPQSYFPSLMRDDSFLGELVGHRITVTFMNGEETSGILNAFYRFAIKLDGGVIIFKHAIRSVHPTNEEDTPARDVDPANVEEATNSVLH